MTTAYPSLVPAGPAGTAHEFRRTWTRAVQLERRGRLLEARRTWVRALRQSVKLGCSRSMRVAMEGLDGGRGGPHLGPAMTPILEKRPRGCRPARLSFETLVGSYHLSRKQIDGFLMQVPMALVVDTVRQQIHVEGERVGMEGREIPLNILATLVEFKGGPISMDTLFQRAWGRRFNAAFDANTVYFHICRLRKILDQVTGGRAVLLKTSDGYQLRTGLRYGLIRHVQPPRAQRGADTVVELVRQRGFITNRTYCEVTRTSRSTALRELAEMVGKGILLRCGSGRGAHYRLGRGAAAAAR